MITITNKNIFRSPLGLNNLLNYNDIHPLTNTEICNFLSEEVELGENTTFKRIFDIIKENSDIFDHIYFSILGGNPIKVFTKEIEKFPSDGVDLDYVSINWSADRYAGSIILSPIVLGNLKSKNFSLEFMPLNNIKYHKIILNEELHVIDYDEEDEDKKLNNIGSKKFTLFELFYSILVEIAFNGSPNERETMFNEIFDMFSDPESDIEESKDLISMEKMFEEFENKDIYLVKYKGYRERIDEELINDDDIDIVKNCIIEKFKIYNEIEKSSNKKLHKYNSKLTNIEYNIQTFYGEDEDKSKHKFWQTPKCICPKIENIEIYPSNDPIIDENCPIHGLKK